MIDENIAEKRFYVNSDFQDLLVVRLVLTTGHFSYAEKVHFSQEDYRMKELRRQDICYAKGIQKSQMVQVEFAQLNFI